MPCQQAVLTTLKIYVTKNLRNLRTYIDRNDILARISQTRRKMNLAVYY
ncbi:MAG: hypothetical protein LBU34_05310 [Planctomycetaceae bacterium]|nr:hypothetical protein [Planctomycetaceae bacterium]